MPIPQRDHRPEAALVPSRRLLTDDVYDRLLDEIVRGTLAGGTRIHDLELASTLGFSRSTIRTALLRLTQLGMVETVPNLYTRVTPVDLDRYLKTQDTARALYVFAVRYATPVMTGEHHEALRRWPTTFGSASRVDPESIFNGSAALGFFQIFLDGLGNGPLNRTMLRLRPHLQRVMGQHADLLPAAPMQAAMQGCVDAALRRDPDGAAASLAEYYDVALETFHARLAELPEFAADRGGDSDPGS